MEGAFFYAVSEFNRSTKTCAIDEDPASEGATNLVLPSAPEFQCHTTCYGYDSMGSNGIYWDLTLKHLHFKSGAKGNCGI
jgi:hypothetical protein